MKTKKIKRKLKELSKRLDELEYILDSWRECGEVTITTTPPPRKDLEVATVYGNTAYPLND